jgi:hypothetical protein
MLKPKSSQSSGCTHIHQTTRKSLTKRLPARKLMAAVFWDRKGVLMVEFKQQGTTITPEVCYETLKNCVGPAIQNKRRGMLTYGVVLFYDNARPHTAACTGKLLEHFNWELFDHPPHSPDLSPSDCHLFTYLKKWLGSQRFNNNEEAVEDVKTWMSSQAYKNVFPNKTSASIPMVTMLRSSLNTYNNICSPCFLC